MKSYMTDPRTFLIRMANSGDNGCYRLVMATVGAAFAGNIALNSVILATALIGVAFIFRQTFGLSLRLNGLARYKTNTINPSSRALSC